MRKLKDPKIRTRIKNAELVAERRKLIAERALELFVANGFDRTTTDQIVEKTGLGIGVIYSYIGSKEDILYLAMEGYSNRALQLSKQLEKKSEMHSPTDALRMLIEDFLRFHDQNQDYTQFVYHETRNVAAEHRQAMFSAEMEVIKIFEKVLSRGCKTGEFRVLNVPVAAHSIAVLIQMWAVRRWYLRKVQDLQAHIDTQTEFILRAVSAIGRNR
jgi:AcrR family transcriptional regulator